MSFSLSAEYNDPCNNMIHLGGGGWNENTYANLYINGELVREHKEGDYDTKDDGFSYRIEIFDPESSMREDCHIVIELNDFGIAFDSNEYIEELRGGAVIEFNCGDSDIKISHP